MNQNVEKMIAKDLLSISAVFLRPDEPFTWASGIKSPIYCDNRLTLTAPAVRTDVETALKAVIEEYYPDVEVLMGTSTTSSTEPPVEIRSSTTTTFCPFSSLPSIWLPRP